MAKIKDKVWLYGRYPTGIDSGDLYELNMHILTSFKIRMSRPDAFPESLTPITGSKLVLFHNDLSHPWILVCDV